MLRKFFSLVGITFLAMMAVGCCHPTRLTVNIEMDEALRAELGSRKIQVDIVGLNANQHARWEGYSMTKYWEAGDTMRDSVASKRLVFDPAVKEPQMLASNDAIWDKWQIWEKKDISDKDMPRLYVLVQLPPITGGNWRATDDQAGEKDPRRQILPLGDCRWKTKNVSILIQKSGVITLTQQVRDNKNQ